MRSIFLLVTLVALPCYAGQVYKCKGPKGEVTFTNIKCPENAAAQHYGSFEPTKDDPRASLAIARDIEQKHDNEERQQQMSAYAAGNDTAYAVAPAGTGGYNCSANGKTWISATPCPSASSHYSSAPVSGTIVETGQHVTGTAIVRESTPVDQQAVSRSQLCDQAAAGAAVGERGKSSGDSGYERRKILNSGCR